MLFIIVGGRGCWLVVPMTFDLFRLCQGFRCTVEIRWGSLWFLLPDVPFAHSNRHLFMFHHRWSSIPLMQVWRFLDWTIGHAPTKSLTSNLSPLIYLFFSSPNGLMKSRFRMRPAFSVLRKYVVYFIILRQSKRPVKKKKKKYNMRWLFNFFLNKPLLALSFFYIKEFLVSTSPSHFNWNVLISFSNHYKLENSELFGWSPEVP